MVIPVMGGPSALVYAASSGRHRPASHTLLSQRTAAEQPQPEQPLSGSRIRTERIARGMSQYDLARAVGVSRPAVAQWESGKYRPYGEHVVRLREVLG